jgi:hypothetical protein
VPKPPTLPVAPVPAELVREYAGWYEPINPRVEITRGLVRIPGLTKLSPLKTGLSLRGFTGRARDYVPSPTASSAAQPKERRPWR